MDKIFDEILATIEGKVNMDCSGLTKVSSIGEYIADKKSDGFDDIEDRLVSGTFGGFDKENLSNEIIIWDYSTSEFFILNSTKEEDVKNMVDYILSK